jgi:Ca2+-transporting ATPase
MSAKYEGIHGLSSEEVERSRISKGENVLPPPEVETFFDKLKENFDEPLIKILVGALVITVILAFLGHADWLEGFGIALAVFLVTSLYKLRGLTSSEQATFVSTYSEYKNENSFRILQEQASQVKNNVFRSGSAVKVNSTEVVVGDLVLLQPGDKVGSS